MRCGGDSPPPHRHRHCIDDDHRVRKNVLHFFPHASCCRHLRVTPGVSRALSALAIALSMQEKPIPKLDRRWLARGCTLVGHRGMNPVPGRFAVIRSMAISMMAGTKSA